MLVDLKSLFLHMNEMRFLQTLSTYIISLISLTEYILFGFVTNDRVSITNVDTGAAKEFSFTKAFNYR